MGISFVMAKAIAKSTSQQLQGVGISNISFISPSTLRFTLSDNSTKDVVLTGLNEFTTEEKTKLASLDSNILTKFSLDVDGNILYNGKILNSIIKSNINGNIIINGTETKVFDDTTINSQLAEKANITDVNNQISAVASGSPKGVYATVSALQTAYPSGNSNTYIVNGDIKEVETLTVTAIPTVAENVTITLNGVTKTIAVNPATDTTTDAVATKIRNTVFAGWTTGGTGSVVTFTKTTSGTNTAPSFSAGSTGCTATIVVTTAGVNSDYGWYYWSGSAWTRGGTYQASAPADGVITKSKLFSRVQNGIDLMTAINICESMNSTPYGYFYSTKGNTNITYSNLLESDNYVHYRVSLSSAVTGFKAWQVSKTYAFTKDNILYIDYNTTVPIKLIIKLKDSSGNIVKEIYDNVSAGSGTYTLTTSLTTCANLYIESLQYNSDSVVGAFDLYNFRIYSNSDIANGVNLSEKINLIKASVNSANTDIANLKQTNAYPLDTYSASSGTATVDTYKKKNNDSSVKISATAGSTFNITFSNLSIPVSSSGRIGIWLYINKSSIETIAGNNIQLYVKLNGTVSNNKYMVYYLHNGWNYYDISDLISGISTITSIQFYTTTAVYNIDMWIDSVELNYKHKPCVMLGFDNCNDANLYGKIYPLLKAKGFKGTFAWQSGAVPDTTSGGYLTQSHYVEMLKDGWDYAMYNGYGSKPTSNYTNNSANLQAWITYLKAYLDLLESYGIFNPICYFSPANTSSQVLINAEKAVGFKMNRMQALTTVDDIEYFDEDSFETSCAGIGATTTVADITARIDEAINKGIYLNIFAHAVEDTTTADYNCLTSVYSGVLDYLETKVNNGEIEVITYREFFQRWCPNEYAEVMNLRQVKQNQYLLSKIG